MSILNSSQNITVKTWAVLSMLAHLAAIGLILTPILLIRMYLPAGDEIGFWIQYAISLIPQAVTDFIHDLRYAYYGLLLWPCLGLLSAYALIKRQNWAIWLNIASIGLWLCQTIVFFVGLIHSLFFADHYIGQHFPRLDEYLNKSITSIEMWMIVFALLSVILQTWLLMSLFYYKKARLD